MEVRKKEELTESKRCSFRIGLNVSRGGLQPPWSPVKASVTSARGDIWSALWTDLNSYEGVSLSSASSQCASSATNKGMVKQLGILGAPGQVAFGGRGSRISSIGCGVSSCEVVLAFRASSLETSSINPSSTPVVSLSRQYM
jgi:hypothetical protein